MTALEQVAQSRQGSVDQLQWISGFMPTGQRTQGGTKLSWFPRSGCVVGSSRVALAILCKLSIVNGLRAA
jgi:hypothetical protein